eukprot:gene51905-14209_t
MGKEEEGKREGEGEGLHGGKGTICADSLEEMSVGVLQSVLQKEGVTEHLAREVFRRCVAAAHGVNRAVRVTGAPGTDPSSSLMVSCAGGSAAAAAPPAPPARFPLFFLGLRRPPASAAPCSVGTTGTTRRTVKSSITAAHKTCPHALTHGVESP